MKCVGGGMCQLGNSHCLSVSAELDYTHLEFIESRIGLWKKIKGIAFYSRIELIQGLTTVQSQFLIAA